ncbi:MAG: ATP-binding protein [Geitlerinemataceae cyanobacterium]
MKTELHIPSDLKFLAVVEQWLLGFLEIGVGEEVDWARQSNRLRLVLAESFSNVVRHAHRDRPEVAIELRMEVKELDVCLEVWDRGTGYDLEGYMAPTPEAMQEGGYGWLIINRLMDRVEYSLKTDDEGRNCLRLEANLADKASSVKTA